jgi:hypothetical protein
MAEKIISGEQYKAMQSKKTGRSMPSTPVALVVGAIIIAGLAFYSGTIYQKDHTKTTTTSSSSSSSGRGAFGGGRFGGGRRPTFGQVTAISDSSITVQASDGTSTTLSITSSTTITDNGTSETTSDIKVGDTVAVVADPTTTSQADRILVNPSFGGGGGQQNSAPSANSQD